MDEYIKTVWVDDSEPAINAANLNKIETGIANGIKAINEIADIISLGGII